MIKSKIYYTNVCVEPLNFNTIFWQCIRKEDGPMRSTLRISFMVSLMILFVSHASSQEQYPTRPITMVVPYTAGMIDTMTRTICKVAEKELGEPIVVENRPGAAASIGMNYVLKSKPDGYTLGSTTTTSYITTPHTQKVPYNVLTDVTDIMAFCRYNQILCVRTDAPWKTYEELIDYAKKNPGKFKYATPGVGTAQHICIEQIAMKEGIKWTAIPFKGGGEAVLATLGGHTDGVGMSSIETSAHIKAGKLRPLLVLTDSRLPDFPEIPTILEKGYHFTATTYVSVYGPLGLPESIRQRLEEVFKKVMSDPSFIEAARRFQIEIPYMSGKEYSAYWRSKYDERGKIIKGLGLEAK
jgi:tripartite-type tricarboxylate transporter receptor subunit TctC